jgi:hypothetical protein
MKQKGPDTENIFEAMEEINREIKAKETSVIKPQKDTDAKVEKGSQDNIGQVEVDEIERKGAGDLEDGQFLHEEIKLNGGIYRIEKNKARYRESLERKILIIPREGESVEVGLRFLIDDRKDEWRLRLLNKPNDSSWSREIEANYRRKAYGILNQVKEIEKNRKQIYEK